MVDVIASHPLMLPVPESDGPKIVVGGGISDSVKMKPEEEQARIEKEKKLAARSVKRALRENIKAAVEKEVEAREQLLRQPEIVNVKIEKIEEMKEQLPQQPIDPSKKAPVIESPQPIRPRVVQFLDPQLPPNQQPHPVMGVYPQGFQPFQPLNLNNIKLPNGVHMVTDQDIFKMCAICAVAGAIVGVGGYRLVLRLVDVFSADKPVIRRAVEVLDSVEDLANVG